MTKLHLCLPLLAPVALVGSLSPASAQPNQENAALRLSVQQRLGETVYCLPEAVMGLEARCFTKRSWRKRGVDIRLPAHRDGSVEARLTATGTPAAQP